MKKILLFAYKYNGEYVAERLIKNQERDFDRLEYGDVKENKFQIWEYPSGKIFLIASDRKIPEEKYYSHRDKNVWQPTLVHIATNKKMVEKAFLKLR
jgi:hypothetical protein